jgi:chromosome partitioning protein
MIISIANQKGGVGKTTTALNLSVALSLMGFKVLVIDFDPQANLSKYAGYNQFDSSLPTMSDILFGQASGKQIEISECILHSQENKIDYIPSDINLANADLCLASVLARETILKRMLDNPTINKYDYVIIDCSPQLGLLLMNALTACDTVLIPVEVQDFGLDGLTALDDVINQIKATLNPSLKILGVLPTMFEETTSASKRILGELKEKYKEKVFHTVIHRATQATNSVMKRRSLCLDKCRLGDEYKSLADEIVTRTCED